MVVMLVSILLFSIVRFDSLLYNFLVRIVLIPVVAGNLVRDHSSVGTERKRRAF